ncbi:hypothetical protein NQ317_012551, partial [Molorchus minor]
ILRFVKGGENYPVFKVSMDFSEFRHTLILQYSVFTRSFYLIEWLNDKGVKIYPILKSLEFWHSSEAA